MKLTGLPTFALQPPAPKNAQVQFGQGASVLVSPDASSEDTVTLGKTKLIIPKKKEDPQAKLYKEIRYEIAHGVQLMTNMYLRAIPEMGPFIVHRNVQSAAIIQAVPKERQPYAQTFFERLNRYYFEPAHEILDKKVWEKAKQDLPGVSDKDLRKILAGEDVKLEYDERMPKALLLQYRKEGQETIRQVVKDAMLAGYNELEAWKVHNSPEIAQKEMEERYDVTSKKYNPHFAYL